MKSTLIPLLFLIPYCVSAKAPEISNDILFKGVTRQSKDFSCGAAALSTLITGLVVNSKISEKNIIDEIAKYSESGEARGYTLSDLMEASKRLGYYAEWHKVPVSELPKIKIPVMLLIGLNSKFPHFVILKGIADGQAFLADSIRGNVRTPYKKLTEEGITEKYQQWFVMAIEPSEQKPKSSNLYLADDRLSSHFTVEQSSAITLSTLPKANQLFASYEFNASFGSAQRNLGSLPLETVSNSYVHSLNVRYGVTESVEVTGKISFNDSSVTTHIPSEIATARGIADRLPKSFGSKQYELGINKRFLLDDFGRNGIITGITGSVSEPNSVWGAKISAIGYTNTSYAQFILGGSIGKQFSSIERISSQLPEFTTTGVVSANKPLGDKYLSSLSFSVNNSHDKKTAGFKSNPTMTVSSGITYVLDKHFQVKPSFGYSFNNGENYTFGTSFAYIGSW